MGPALVLWLSMLLEPAKLHLPQGIKSFQMCCDAPAADLCHPERNKYRVRLGQVRHPSVGMGPSGPAWGTSPLCRGELSMRSAAFPVCTVTSEGLGETIPILVLRRQEACNHHLRTLAIWTPTRVGRDPQRRSSSPLMRLGVVQ